MANIRWKDKPKDTSLALEDRIPVTVDPNSTSIDKHVTREDLKTYTSITKVSSNVPYTLRAEDEIVLLDASSGDITVFLPTLNSQPRRPIVLKRIDSTVNSVTVEPETSGELLEGSRFDFAPSQFTGRTFIPDVSLGKWYQL